MLYPLTPDPPRRTKYIFRPSRSTCRHFTIGKHFCREAEERPPLTLGLEWRGFLSRAASGRGGVWRRWAGQPVEGRLRWVMEDFDSGDLPAWLSGLMGCPLRLSSSCGAFVSFAGVWAATIGNPQVASIFKNPFGGRRYWSTKLPLAGSFGTGSRRSPSLPNSYYKVLDQCPRTNSVREWSYKVILAVALRGGRTEALSTGLVSPSLPVGFKVAWQEFRIF